MVDRVYRGGAYSKTFRVFGPGGKIFRLAFSLGFLGLTGLAVLGFVLRSGPGLEFPPLSKDGLPSPSALAFRGEKWTQNVKASNTVAAAVPQVRRRNGCFDINAMFLSKAPLLALSCP